MVVVINKVAIIRRLEAIKNAIETGRRSLAAVARQELASHVDLDADDPSSAAVSNVFQLTGKWMRGAVDIEPTEIKTAIEQAIALLKR